MIYGWIVLALLSNAWDTQRAADELVGIKCIVTGETASLEHSCRCKQGTLYFHSESSKQRYESQPGRFQTKANHQLVVTGQYVQRRCPVSKALVDHRSATKTVLAGVVLRFSSPVARQQLESEDENRQRIASVFESPNFDRLFAPAPRDTELDRDRSGHPAQGPGH